jgi:hypothetical protein
MGCSVPSDNLWYVGRAPVWHAPHRRKRSKKCSRNSQVSAARPANSGATFYLGPRLRLLLTRKTLTAQKRVSTIIDRGAGR